MVLKDKLVKSIFRDENQSCQEMYYASKKYDDYDMVASLDYHVNLLSAFGLDSNRKDEVINSY
jgi:hypothetical protein